MIIYRRGGEAQRTANALLAAAPREGRSAEQSTAVVRASLTRGVCGRAFVYCFGSTITHEKSPLRADAVATTYTPRYGLPEAGVKVTMYNAPASVGVWKSPFASVVVRATSGPTPSVSPDV